jgi:hypothetical protein
VDEANGAADAPGVNAFSSVVSELDEVEGVTARIVDLCGEEGTSSRTSNSFSWRKNSDGSGDDGGVLPCENRMEEGENEEATTVSASDVLVDVECLIAFRCCKGFGTRVWPASIFATALATELRSETPEPLRSNAYPGTLRAGNI